ncbi:MAG: lysophospholipid acyltransferase family protein [Sulfuritalea sp.]|nr:lysophospholipid acyltransferase family protein [Sulfuritalea sp.]
MTTLAARVRLLLVGLHLLFGAFQAAALFRLGGTRWRQQLKRVWSRQLLGILGIRIESGDNLSSVEGGLLVGNHISFIDIFVINALLPCAFVAKSEVGQWPLIGWLSRQTGTVFIERGSRKAAHRTHQQMRPAFDAGQRLAIFPAGTTTAGDTLLPFHGALFQSAIDAAVPVHAIALSYHDAGGARSEAPAYIGDISLIDCLMRVLQAGGLVVRVTLAASFVPPLPDRRHLAHRAHQAVATALAIARGQVGSPAFDPGNRGQNPSEGSAQCLGNEAAISP